MSGMGMDPTAMSQNFYGNFGGPGMGMNGMNMGMGFDAGQSMFGGFNPSQGPYGQIGGNYGANAGFGGYNMPQQGNFNQMSQQNFNHDFFPGHQQGFQYRGRGRGRGNFVNAGRGRGHPQAFPGRQMYHDASQEQSDQPPARRGSPDYSPINGARDDKTTQQPPSSEPPVEDAETQRVIEEQLKNEFAPGDADDEAKPAENTVEPDNATDMSVSKEESMVVEEQHEEPKVAEAKEIAQSPPTSKLNEIESKTEKPATSPTMGPPLRIPTGPASQRNEFSNITSPLRQSSGRQFPRATSDRGSFDQSRDHNSHSEKHARTSSVSVSDSLISPTVEPRGLGVQGAPTAPKALRQGLPNTGIRPSMDTGIAIVGRASSFSQDHANGRRRSRRYFIMTANSFDKYMLMPISPRPPRSHSRSRSPSRRDSSPRRAHRHRSRSTSRDKKRERRHSHQKHPSRDEYGRESHEYRDSVYRGNHDSTSSRRESQKSSRDAEKGSSRSKHRSRRSQHDPSRSREREREHHSSRKRSKSPDFRINGASRRKTEADRGGSDRYDDDEDSARLFRKRRDRETADDANRHRERKRSRRDDDHDLGPQPDDRPDLHHRSSRRNGDGLSSGGGGRRGERGGTEKRSSRHVDDHQERPPRRTEGSRDVHHAESPPRDPKIDQHALEREARNRERQMKEIQRRALMEGVGSIRGKSGKGTQGERRHSAKYEDEQADLASRVEREREGGRWR